MNKDSFTIGAMVALVAAINLPSSADQVVLEGGDVLTGTIVERTAGDLLLEHATLGPLRISLDDVVEIEAAASPAVFAEGALAAPKPASDWKSRFDVGASGSFGNSDQQSLHIGVHRKRKDDFNRTGLDAHYYLGISNGDRTENKFTSGVIHDWLMPDSPWLRFVDARFDYDEFQAWEYRLSGHVGAGYHLIDEEDYDLILRGGVGGRYEFNSVDNGWFWEALFGFDMTRAISDRQSFELSSTIYPDLSDTGEYRTLTTAAWNYDLDNGTNMSLSAGLSHEYRSIVDPMEDHNDWKIFAGLGFDF